MRTLTAILAALVATAALAQTPPPATPEPAPAPPPAAAPPAAPPIATPPGAAAKVKAADGVVLAPRAKITLSGRFWGSVENVRSSGGTRPGGVVQRSRTRVSNDTSYVTIAAEAEIGPGWAAVGQVEAELGLDGENGTPFASTRNTGAGLRGPVGTLIFGRWDSPTKRTTIVLDPFGGTGIFGYYNVFGQHPTSATGQGSNRWDRRLNNGIVYTSPTLAGFSVLAGYSVGETPQNGTVRVEPWTASGALHYKAGPLYAGVSYEYRNDCGNPDASAPAGASCNAASLATRGHDQAVRAGVGLTIKATRTKLGAAYEHVELEGDATATAAKKTLQRDVYWGTITQGMGSDRHELILSSGRAGDVRGTGVFADKKGTGAWTLSAVYRFWATKHLDLYGGFVTIENGKNATYRLGSVNFGSVAVGSTTRGYGGGMRWLF